jgi:hypothetical protein
MDRRERAALAGSGLESESGNVRADGFFSVQVCDVLHMQMLHRQCLFMCSAGCLRIGRLGNGIERDGSDCGAGARRVQKQACKIIELLCIYLMQGETSDVSTQCGL